MAGGGDRTAGLIRLTWRIKIVLVLDKEHSVACPRPGGEPLYSMAALWVSSRRLPGTSQRDVLPIPSAPCGGYNGP